MQHFNEPQKTDQVSGAPLVSQPTEQKAEWQTSVFAFLSPQGQQTVGDYLAHLERGLAKADVASKALSTFERDDALREIQNHLASLIVAYQELGDDEPKAIRSAIAQFGAARDVSSGLRRAKARQIYVISPDIIVPMLLFSLALLMPVFVTMFPIPLQWIALHKWSPEPGMNTAANTVAFMFGWPALLLLPFLAGVFSGNRKGKDALRGLLAAMAAVLGLALVMNAASNEHHKTSEQVHGEIFAILFQVSVYWLASAGLGIVLARSAYTLKRKRKAA